MMSVDVVVLIQSSDFADVERISHHRGVVMMRVMYSMVSPDVQESSILAERTSSFTLRPCGERWDCRLGVQKNLESMSSLYCCWRLPVPLVNTRRQIC